jgi:hypothetical protein
MRITRRIRNLRRARERSVVAAIRDDVSIWRPTSSSRQEGRWSASGKPPDARTTSEVQDGAKAPMFIDNPNRIFESFNELKQYSVEPLRFIRTVSLSRP